MQSIRPQHYKVGDTFEAINVIEAWDLDFCLGNVIKYITRHRAENGKADVEKAILYCELILELVYGVRDEPVVITVPEPPKPRRGRPPGAKNKKRKAK